MTMAQPKLVEDGPSSSRGRQFPREPDAWRADFKRLGTFLKEKQA
jgi:hypothetical protein